LERIDSMELDTAMSYFEEHSHSLDDKLKEAWTVLRNHLCTLNTRTEDGKEERVLSFMYEGKKVWHKEGLLSYLLDEELVFCNSRKYVCLDGTIKPATTVVFAVCNDVFVWACSDAEPIKPSEFHELYELHEDNKQWGAMKWACKKRNLQPQVPIVVDMKKDGYWDEEMESLMENK